MILPWLSDRERELPGFGPGRRAAGRARRRPGRVDGSDDPVRDGSREVRPLTEQRLVALDLLGPVACERLEEVLPDAGTEVDGARPDRARARVARGADDSLELLLAIREAGKDRRHPHADVDPGVGECAYRAQPARGRRRSWLGRSPDALVECGEGEVDAHLDFTGSCGEELGVADDERPAGHDRERCGRSDEFLETRSCESESALRGLIRIGRGAECDLLVSPGATRELPSEHLGDVLLHADRSAVAVVRGPVGSLFEMADVTERAPVDAPHVWVERPPKWHPAHQREGGLARLHPILDLHRSRIEHMFDRDKRG